MFLKLTCWYNPTWSTAKQKRPEHTWVNFNNVIEFQTYHFVKDSHEEFCTRIYFTSNTAEDVYTTDVKETPEIICQMLLEKTAVKVLYGGK